MESLSPTPSWRKVILKIQKLKTPISRCRNRIPPCPGKLFSQNLTRPRQPSHIMELVKSYINAICTGLVGGGGGATTLRKYWTYIWVIFSLNSSTALHSVVLPKREAFCGKVPGIQNSPHFLKPVSNGGTSLRTFRVVFSDRLLDHPVLFHGGLHWTKRLVIISGCSWWQPSVFTLGKKKVQQGP